MRSFSSLDAFCLVVSFCLVALERDLAAALRNVSIYVLTEKKRTEVNEKTEVK